MTTAARFAPAIPFEPDPAETWSSGVVVASPAGSGRESVALVSDRRLTVAALAALLMDGDREAEVDAAEGLVDVRRMLERHRPTVVVVDVSWPWPATMERLTRDVPLILLIDPKEASAAFSAAQSLAPQGYLSRTASQQALQTAIAAVATVGRYVDPVLAGRVMWSGRNPRDGAPDPISLSKREREILVEIANGRSTKEIARAYALQPKTIRNYVSDIYAKLNLSHRGELVLYAAREGIAQPVLPTTPAREVRISTLGPPYSL